MGGIAGFLIFGGLTALVAAWVTNKTASFDDGSFLVEATLLVVGPIAIVIGVILLIVSNI